MRSGAAAAAGAAAKKVKRSAEAAATAAASTPPPRKAAKSGEAPSSARATEVLREALSGNGSAAELIISKLQLSDASSSSEHAAEVGGLKARIEVLQRENTMLKEGSGKKDGQILTLSKEKAALEGQLAEMSVDKQTLGELKGGLEASKSEIAAATAQVTFLQEMLTRQLALPAQPERPSHPPPPSYPYPPPAPYPPPQYPPPQYPPPQYSWHPPPSQPMPVQPPSQQTPVQPPPSMAPAPAPAPAPVPAELPPSAPPSHHPNPYGYPPPPYAWPQGYGHMPR